MGDLLFPLSYAGDLRSAGDLGDLCMSVGDLCMSVGDLCISVGDLCMSVGDLCISVGDLCMSVGDLCISGEVTVKPKEVINEVAEKEIKD